MSKWVLIGILNESDIVLLDDNLLLDSFAECSRDVIIKNIINYIKDPNSDPDIVTRLRRSYKDILIINETSENEDLLEVIGTVTSLDYGSVHAGLSIKQLEELRQKIYTVYNEDMNVPYVQSRTLANLKDLVQNIKSLSSVTGNKEFKRIASAIDANRVLFVDSRKAAKGTIFKKVSKHSDVLDILLEGIEFLIERKTDGDKPESWRIF